MFHFIVACLPKSLSLIESKYPMYPIPKAITRKAKIIPTTLLTRTLPSSSLNRAYWVSQENG